MTHVLKRNHLFDNFLLRQLLARDVLVAAVVGAVAASVDTVVGEVKRGKHDDAVAVKPLFDVFGKGIHLFDGLLVLTLEQDSSFPMTEPLVVGRPFEQAVDQLEIVLIFLCVFQCFKNFIVVDEFGRNG